MTAPDQPKTARRTKRQRLDKRCVVGLPQLRFIENLTGYLHTAGDHPNRKLFLDDLVIALLVAFFNPVARSLRGVEDASQMPGINQYLRIGAVRRSTASDALAAFDPDLLLPLIHDLRRRVSPRQVDAADDTLRGLLNRLMIYDGSYFRTAHDVTWALCERHGQRLRGRVRLNLHLSARDGVPVGVSVAGRDDPGEPVAILDHVEAGQVVVADRGCFSHATVHELLKRRVDFVLRLQSGVRCDVVAERTLTEADREAGVISDQTVRLTGKKNPHPTTLRLVTIRPESDSTRDGDHAKPVAAAADAPSPLRLLTSIQDEWVLPWMIGHVYRRRWDIELFFRWLKTVAQWDHLFSESRNGVLTQCYVAMIGTLLLAVCTGRKPDRYSFNLLCMVAAGQGSLDDALAILQRRHAERDRDRQRRLERRDKKTS